MNYDKAVKDIKELASNIILIICIVVLSACAFPVTYAFNTIITRYEKHEYITLILAVGALLTMVLIVFVAYWIPRVARKNEGFHWFFYVFAVFTFTSVVDLTLSLEHDGYIYGFMTMYLKYGEVYYISAYGAVSCYIDAFVFYFQHIYMAVCVASGYGYRKTGLYWAGSILNSLYVIVTSAIVKPGPAWATLLNIPYVALPTMVAVRLWNVTKNKDLKATQSPCFRCADLAIAIGLVFVILFHALRGFITLGASGLFAQYCKDVEPYLLYNDPSPFVQSQMLYNFFIVIPFCILAIYGLYKNPRSWWMRNTSLIHAGIVFQGQVTHMVGGVYSTTPKDFRHNTGSPVFWIVNISVLAFPHLLAIRSNCSGMLEKFIRSQVKIE